MSAYPGGYSDPNQYGSAFGNQTQPPMPSYGHPVQTQPTTTVQIDPQAAAIMQQQLSTMAITALNPNDPTKNENPVRMNCPSCHADVTTSTEYVYGTCTYLSCLMCVLICCPFFIWLPFVSNSFKDVVHTCPSCKAECGRFDRSQQRRGTGRVGGTGFHVGKRGRIGNRRRIGGRRRR